MRWHPLLFKTTLGLSWISVNIWNAISNRSFSTLAHLISISCSQDTARTIYPQIPLRPITSISGYYVSSNICNCLHLTHTPIHRTFKALCVKCIRLWPYNYCCVSVIFAAIVSICNYMIIFAIPAELTAININVIVSLVYLGTPIMKASNFAWEREVFCVTCQVKYC